MLTRKTVVDEITIRRDGSTQIRLGLLILDGDKEIATEWHRTTVEPGGDVDAQLAIVDTALRNKGHAALENNMQAALRAVKRG